MNRLALVVSAISILAGSPPGDQPERPRTRTCRRGTGADGGPELIQRIESRSVPLESGWRARGTGPRESQEEAPTGPIRHDGHVVPGQQPRVPLRPALSGVHRPGQGRLRNRAGEGEDTYRMARRDRPVLPGRHPDDHDARVADHDGAGADRRRHGLELQQRVPADLHRRASVQRSRHGDVQLQRRVHRQVRRRHAGRRDALHRDLQPLHRRRHPDFRRVQGRGAHPAARRPARCSRSNTS